MAVSTSIYDAANTTVAIAKTDVGGSTADNHVNEEPIHDATRDIDANIWNRLIAYISEVGVNTRPGNLVMAHYLNSNVAGSLTDDVLQMAGISDDDESKIVAFRGGSIVGIAARLENAITAGGASALVIEPRAAATKLSAISLTLDDTTNTQKNRVWVAPNTANITFAALDELDVVITTDAAFAAGATPSLRVDLLISYDGAGEAL